MSRSPTPSGTTTSTARGWDPLGQLAIVVGYLVMAWIGFALVQPPFYNNVVWPADGFALGLMLARGRQLWPGVFLGALLANLVVVFPALSGGGATLPIASTVVLASAGVTTQLLLTTWLISRQLRPGLSYSGWENARFLLIAGPLGVAWGATIGLGAYTWLGLFDATYFWSRWSNWYAAGIVGVVTVAPITYLWTSPFDTSPLRRKFGMTASIASVLLVVTSVLYILRTQENVRIDLSVHAEAETMSMALAQYVGSQTNLLDVARAHLESVPQVDKQQFERFGRRVLETNETIVNLLWLPRVSASERKAMEARLSNEYGRPLQFRRADDDLTPIISGGQPVYYPVFYALGRGRFGDFIGTDWGYAQALGPLISRTTLGLQPVLTPPFPIPRKADGVVTTFLLQIVPVRRIDCEAAERGLENPCIRGLVAVVTTAEVLAAEVWPEAFLARFDITLWDEGSAGPIFRNVLQEPLIDHFKTTLSLPVVDRSWGLTAIPAAGYATSFRSGDTWLLITLLSLFCITIVWVLLYSSSAHSRVVEEVRIKTRQLAAATDEAQRANRAKSEFLANMSHELRTPLNAIIGFTRRVLGREGSISERGREALQTVERNSQHLLTLINDLLDISRIEAGKLQVLREPVSVSELAEEICAQLEPLATQRQLYLRNVVPATLPPVLGDRTRILQMLFNLVSNAIKFTEKGGIELRATIAVQDSRKGVALSVMDTGVGIPRKDLEKLFHRYSQLEHDTKPGLQGSGLGLVLVRELASLQGGTVSVQSEPGRGSVFTLWLPALV